MLNAIYEKIADKTLSFGCKCWIHEPDAWCNTMINIWTIKKETLFSKKYVEAFWHKADRKIIYENYEIIWHPVKLGDVMDYFEKLPNEKIIKILQETEKIFLLWQEKRKPIEEQSNECVEFVYNLISE